jgi:D-glucuronyl C5-epimerase C-terminus
LLAAAARAYAAVPPLLLELSGGPWIRLYGFDHEIVLNAQLQTIVSLLEYAQISGDADVLPLAQRLERATQALFQRFDTGEWSRYELGGGYASLDYESFVTDLLAKLASVTEDPFWVDASQRFYDYLHTPAQVIEGGEVPPLYPEPQDGFLDTASIPITLSQRASVTLAVGGTITTWRLNAGPHTLVWKPPADLAPGTYAVRVSTVTYAKNRQTFQLAPVVVQWDTLPPQGLAATLSGTTLAWQATDPGTPWLGLKLDLVDATGANPPQQLDLGQQPTSGTLTVTLPPGTWLATTLEATNSAGLTSTVSLTPPG